MTNLQFYTLLFGPMIFNALLIGLLKLYITSKIKMLSTNITARPNAIEQHFWRTDLYKLAEKIGIRFRGLDKEIGEIKR